MNYLRKLIVSFLLIVLGLVQDSFAQQSPYDFEQINLFECGVSAIPNQPSMDSIDAFIREQMLLHNQGFPSLLDQKCPTCLTIPVVIHIVHSNGPENISDAQAIQAIDWLNNAYLNQAPYGSALGADAQIQFCLAQRDTLGNPSTGITRDVSPFTSMTMETEDLQLKDINRWNPNDYLNIWVVSAINSQAYGPGVAGYAYFPSSHGNNHDGIVIEADFMGASQGNTTVLMHEAGHYLGLHHTFEGGCTNNDCLSDGDKVCDTPPDNSTANVPCAGSINTCTSDEDDVSTNNPFRPVGLGGQGDQDDMHTNYMDYGLPQCFNTFTQGQADRMTVSLLGPRVSLTQSQACLTPCTVIPVASFDASQTNAVIGTTVNFTNTSTGSTTYQWYVDGTPISTQQNTSHTFNATGTFTVALTSSTTQEGCSDSIVVQIEIYCDAQADFTYAPAQVNPGDNVTFTSSSTGMISEEWLVDGVSVGSGSSLNHQFQNQGGFFVQLVACSNLCCDTLSQYITVGLCSDLSQHQWRFGDGIGLDFTSGSPVLVSGGPPSITQEGTAMMSDPQGNLLFYSNGEIVWDGNNNVMPNGSGMLGNQSSFQAAAVVPHPGNPDRYFLFTNDHQISPLYYSEIDMTLNGGLGDVVAGTKNTLLSNHVNESLTTTRHCNGIDYWVIYPDTSSGTFNCHLVDANGVDPTPVQSVVPFNLYTTYLSLNSTNDQIGFGACHFNPVTLATSPCWAAICDFDASTGIISNPRTYEIDSSVLQYGASFSPDGSKFYISGINMGSSLTNNVLQLDLSLQDSTLIQNNIYYFNPAGQIEGGGIQLGPDGRIYHATEIFSATHIGIIENPNSAGAACSYNPNGIPVPPNTLQAGMPNILKPRVSGADISISGSPSICLPDDSVTYSISLGCSITDSDSIEWQHTGPNTVLGISSDASEIYLDFQTTGTDSLFVTVYTLCGIGHDTLVIQSSYGEQTDLGPNIVLCAGDQITLNPGTGFDSYQWSDNSTGPDLTVSTAGTYWVQCVSDQCISYDTITILTEAQASFTLPNDTSMCQGGTIVIQSTPSINGTYWQDNTFGDTYTVFAPGTYWLTLESSCGLIVDTIVVHEIPSQDLVPDTIICVNNLAEVSVIDSFIGYWWNELDGTHQFSTSANGEYTVSVTDNFGCMHLDTFMVVNCDGNNPGAPCAGLIPNAITPNGDEINDWFVIDCESGPVQLVIFNRWGNPIYSSGNYQNDWNGADLTDGTYFYHVRLGDDKTVYHGFFHLIH